MTPREFALFCSVLHVDSPRKLRSVAVASDVARRYLAPFIVKASVDMLGNLSRMVSGNHRARVIFLGRDGYIFSSVIRQLEPLFHNRYCADLHISRITADAAVEEAKQWKDPLPDTFRKPGPHRTELLCAWRDLVAYSELDNLYLDNAGAEFALVDNGFKGSVQEMLTAAYPNAVFHGHYLFYSAAPEDQHAAQKTGYILHLNHPNPVGGRAIRNRFIDDPALTFAHHDAIVAVEDLLRGSDADSRILGGLPMKNLVEEAPHQGINPDKIAPQYADPFLRQAVLAAIAQSVSIYAQETADARHTRPETWYADLTQHATALQPQIHEWLADRPMDPALGQLLDSFVRRADKDRWTHYTPASAPTIPNEARQAVQAAMLGFPKGAASPSSAPRPDAASPGAPARSRRRADPSLGR